MRHFFDGCYSAGPLGCPFYAPSPSAISQNLSALYDSVRSHPIPVRTESSYGIVDYNLLRMTVFTSLYIPYAAFLPLAGALADLAAGDGRRLLNMFRIPPLSQLKCECGEAKEAEATFVGRDPQNTVLCNDGERISGDLEDLQKYVENLTAQTEWGDVWASIRASCV